jgi:hypothetical protein
MKVNDVPEKIVATRAEIEEIKAILLQNNMLARKMLRALDDARAYNDSTITAIIESVQKTLADKQQQLAAEREQNKKKLQLLQQQQQQQNPKSNMP